MARALLAAGRGQLIGGVKELAEARQEVVPPPGDAQILEEWFERKPHAGARAQMKRPGRNARASRLFLGAKPRRVG